MQWEIIFLLAQNLVFYAHNNIVDALVGRNVRRAEVGEFNNVVCIVQRSNQDVNLQFDVQCTGTLITRTHILTSEHCFTNMGLYSLYVLIGSVELRCCEEFYIAWWLTYELWAFHEGREIEYNINDIAIIRLIDHVSELIIPAFLIWQPNSNLFGLDVDLAGYGRLQGEIVTSHLHTVKTRIISNEDCEAVHERLCGYQIVLNERYLCSLAEPSAHVYSGDSGGPVFFGGYILAVSQGTMPDIVSIGDPRRANVHFTINFYREFIEQTMNI